MFPFGDHTKASTLAALSEDDLRFRGPGTRKVLAYARALLARAGLALAGDDREAALRAS